MNLGTKAVFVKDASGSDDYDPRKPGTGFDDDEPTKTTRWVNMTTMSAAKTYLDYGVSDARMVTVRSLDPLPDFDRVEINGVTYVDYAHQAIGDRRSMVLKEIDA